MDKLNWGIVSAGRISEQFVSDLAFVENSRVLGVAARKVADAQAFAKKHEIERTYEGYQALFDDPDIDIVYIGTPHTAHFQNCVDALNAGKHVLCEKPLVVSPEQCLTLCELAKAKGLYFMEAMWSYYLPVIQQAKTWIEQGRIGNIKHVKAEFGYPIPFDDQRREYNSQLAGGCLLEMGIYPLAIASYFLGEDVGEWHVDAHLADNGVEDDVIMIGHFGDAKATLATSFQCKLNNYAYIIGDKGYIAMHDFWRANSAQLYVIDDVVDEFIDDRNSIGLAYEAQAVANDILSGKKSSDIVTHQRSLWLQQQMSDIKKATGAINASK